MNFHVLTLFPEMIMNGLETSILGRAAAKGIVSFEAVNIRDYTLERHGKVDDYPYGGGAGMVMQAEPIYRAYEALVEKIGKKPRVIYMTPQGKTFNQILAFCRTQFYFSDSIHMILRSPCHFSQDLLMSRYRTVFSFQCHPQSFLLQDVIHSPVCDQPSIIFFYRIDHLFLEQFHRLIPAVCSCDGKYHI